MLYLLRTLIGLALGILLFILGIPTVLSLNRRFGLYPDFGYTEAVLGMLLVLACVIAVQLSGLKPPRPPVNKEKE